MTSHILGLVVVRDVEVPSVANQRVQIVLAHCKAHVHAITPLGALQRLTSQHINGAFPHLWKNICQCVFYRETAALCLSHIQAIVCTGTGGVRVIGQTDIAVIVGIITRMELPAILQVLDRLYYPVESGIHVETAILVDGAVATGKEMVQWVIINVSAITGTVLVIRGNRTVCIVGLYQWRCHIGCLHDVPVAATFC